MHKYSSNAQTKKSVEHGQFHQQKAHKICQDRCPFRAGKCRNPRCSLDCRCNFAKLEATALIEQIKLLPAGYRVYFGNFSIRKDLDESEHREIRSKFLEQLSKYSERTSSVVKFRANSEIGDNLRIHYHYAIYSNISISKQMVKSWLSAACGSGRRTSLDHDPPRKSVRAACDYMFKNTKDARAGTIYIRLFRKKTIYITWESKKFFAVPKKQLWEKANREFLGERFVEWKSNKRPKRSKPPTPGLKRSL